MMNLRTLLEEYKNITVILIEKAKKDEDLTDLISKSNYILAEAKKTDYTKKELEEILMELNIIELENELRFTIKKEMVQIKKKIENIRTTKIARETYRNQRRNLKLFIAKA